MAGNQRSGPVKVSVVGGGQGGSKIWRRERIEMTDPDLDDVAFLSGMHPYIVYMYMCGYHAHAQMLESVCYWRRLANGHLHQIFKRNKFRKQ